MNVNMKKFFFALLCLSLILGLSGCGGEKPGKTLRIGYFPNVTHAPAMLGLELGIYQKHLGEDIIIEEKYFSNGQELLTALAIGAIDIGYVGPGPVEQRRQQGMTIQILAEVTRGGSALVVRRGAEIENIGELAGKRVAVPGFGNTQDRILRRLLAGEGLKSTLEGGEVEVRSQKPATISGLFLQQQLEAALLAEPWPSLLEGRGLGRVIYHDNGTSALLVTAPGVYQEKRELIQKYLQGYTETVRRMMAMSRQEQVQLLGHKIKAITGNELPPTVFGKSLSHIQFVD